MKNKTLVTCGQMNCGHNYNGYCQRRNIHITSKERTCDVFNPREKLTKKGGSGNA